MTARKDPRGMRRRIGAILLPLCGISTELSGGTPPLCDPSRLAPDGLEQIGDVGQLFLKAIGLVANGKRDKKSVEHLRVALQAFCDNALGQVVPVCKDPKRVRQLLYTPMKLKYFNVEYGQKGVVAQVLFSHIPNAKNMGEVVCYMQNHPDIPEIVWRYYYKTLTLLGLPHDITIEAFGWNPNYWTQHSQRHLRPYDQALIDCMADRQQAIELHLQGIHYAGQWMRVCVIDRGFKPEEEVYVRDNMLAPSSWATPSDPPQAWLEWVEERDWLRTLLSEETLDHSGKSIGKDAPGYTKLIELLRGQHTVKALMECEIQVDGEPFSPFKQFPEDDLAEHVYNLGVEDLHCLLCLPRDLLQQRVVMRFGIRCGMQERARDLASRLTHFFGIPLGTPMWQIEKLIAE